MKSLVLTLARKIPMKTSILAILAAFAIPCLALEPGTAITQGSVTVTAFYQGVSALPFPPGFAPPPGLMLILVTTNSETTEFVVTVKGDDPKNSKTKTFQRFPAGNPTTLWFPMADPASVKTVVIEEKKVLSSAVFK
jgi:hypothetical protein